MGKKKSRTPDNATEDPSSPGTEAKPTEDAASATPAEAPAKPAAEKKPKVPAEPAGPPPELRLLARGRGGLQAFSGPDWKPCEGYALPPSDETEFCFSPDGKLLVAADHKAGTLNVYDSVTGELRYSLPEPKVINLYVSPKSTYLVSMRRYEKDDVPNLAVWDLATGKESARLFQSRWPALSWSMDEGVCIRMTNNGVLAMSGANFAAEQADGRLDNAKVDALAVSPNLPPFVAVFTKQAKGQPAHVKVYRAPNLTEEVCQKSMFKADSCSLFWNSAGSAVIINCKTDQDTTGQSYYGESLLYLMLPKQKETMNVTVGKAGEQVHDVAWAPNGAEFIVISGTMPRNRATLFNLKGEQVFDFGTSPRNTVAWAPNSRFIALCGFGNLAGEIQFWDRRKVDKPGAKIGECRMSSCTAYAWSPDSRQFLCAVTAPRMKVDNKITIFKHNGLELFTVPFSGDLYQTEFKPEKAKMFPNREPSPAPAEHRAQQAAAAPALFKARGSSGLERQLRKERQ
eukprot:EG_transcript_9985